jgi:hypothetical protein
MQCTQPDLGKEICNGLENITITNDVVSSSLLNACSLNSTNWATCFNCPSIAPTLENPTPETSVASNDPNYRHPVPDNCDSVWWDPLAGQCLCTNSTCAYNDTGVPISTKFTVINAAAVAQQVNTEKSNAMALSITSPILALAMIFAAFIAL